MDFIEEMGDALRQSNERIAGFLKQRDFAVSTLSAMALFAGRDVVSYDDHVWINLPRGGWVYFAAHGIHGTIELSEPPSVHDEEENYRRMLAFAGFAIEAEENRGIRR